MNIYLDGAIYEDYGLLREQRFHVIPPHNFTDGQEVCEGKDYEKQHQLRSFGGGTWVTMLKKDYDTLTLQEKRIVALPLAQPVQQVEEKDKDVWVRVEDGLPDSFITVLIFSEFEGYAVSGYYANQDNIGWVSHMKLYNGKVTHWQPLPPPPKN